jgi:hypothetical protein
VEALSSKVATPVKVVPAKVVEPVLVWVPATFNSLPDPTFKPTLVPVPSALKRASTKSKSVFSLVPQLSALAPTSGLVKPRFVVVVSAIIAPLSNFQTR